MVTKRPPPRNEWARLSPTLTVLPEDPVKSTHPFVVAQARDGVGGGMGLFVYLGIRAGEVVWAERKGAGGSTTAIPRTRAWIDALPPTSRAAYQHFMYKTGEDEYQSLAEFNDVPVERYPEVRTVDVSNYMNHSCDPTCWFVDGGDEWEGAMVARRDLRPGDELTFDYATSEDDDRAESWVCACGAPSCRGHVSPQDWGLPQVQEAYRGHFLPHVADRIAHATGEPIPSLEPVDMAESTWWLRLQADPAYAPSPALMPSAIAGRATESERALARCAARGAALELLNRQAAALIAQHRLAVREREHIGRYIEAGARIPRGEVVMLLPPNLLLWEEEVTDYNRVLQIASDTASGARLFSSSLSADDLDNFLCHSCDPNTAVHIGADLTAALVAVRDIEVGENVCFDYDTTEDDLTGDKGGFSCACGAARCRGQVLGRQHASEPEALPLPATTLSLV